MVTQPKSARCLLGLGDITLVGKRISLKQCRALGTLLAWMINNLYISFNRGLPPKFILELLWAFQRDLGVAIETRLSLSQTYSGSVQRVAGGCMAQCPVAVGTMG